MKEIGGYFGLDNLVSNEFYDRLIALNTGRNTLLYLMKARNITKLHIPYYLCDSVSTLLVEHGYRFEYYYIDQEFQPIFDKQLEQGEYLYIVNLFGQLTKQQTLMLKQHVGQVIFDHSHAFFQEPLEGIDTIYSCRKFFGVPDGAYLATDAILPETLEQDVSSERMKHIIGRYEGTASSYYSDFQRNDDVLDATPLRTMSKLTHNLMGAIDYDRAQKTRNENYAYLDKQLGANNPLKLTTPQGAFAYPILVENGQSIRKQLAEQDIYIPLLWPNVLADCPEDSIEYQYAANILPLPCDQRYSLEDMEYLVDVLKKQLV
ncbi:hypothetical protein A1A1_12617 [Planococcus antarcticus DSM 14505]|uniref:DegT/DnrJ/EryC1/StrS aminotransferase family protein n=1 Tax=Planococcus antarcticus DSM 14505 TaxID=1185653 RepID=A0AA87IKL8_9BACL|nr:hypothetical protein [Planococcus antarcticus]EIM06107.1 hypothetical protein A1A1_12617 [Planococcus antarcticus DSM 14505]